MRLPTRKSELLKRTKQDDGPVYLTRKGIEKMEREIERIKRELPAAREELQRTREMGDLSENAAYQEAKFTLRRMDSRKIVLEERLKIVIEIEKDESVEVVQLGSTVVVEVAGEKKTFEMVGPLEANPMKGSLSYKSPLGVSLMGKGVGEVVKAGAERTSEYTIIKIT